ncbi:MAG: hypothetical protein CM15mV5_0360 [uncultured marine virus]|nr:MAG: hypothetical protein CM15mV5_0360 [uncultured marine virus]
MPNVTAGTNGVTRKFNKLPTDQTRQQVTLSTINITTATVTADQATSITVTADNIGYLRPE